MADANLTLAVQGGDVPQTLGDLRNRLKAIRKEAEATSTANVSAFKKFRDETRKLNAEINSLTKDPRGRSQFFDQLGAQAEKTALKFLSFQTIMRGFGRLFDSMIKNSKSLSDKMDGVQTASDAATGALGDFFSQIDDKIGVTERLNRELYKMANLISGGTTGQRGLALAKLLNPVVGASSFIYDDFGVLDDSARITTKAVDDYIKKRKESQKASALAGAQNEVTQAKAYGEELDRLIKKQEKEIDQVKEEAQSIQDLLDAREALRKSVEEIGDTGDIGTSDVTRDKIRRAQLKGIAEFKAEEQEAIDDAEEKRTRSFIRSANVFGNVLEQAILNGGDAFEKTFKALIAKLAIGAGFGLIGQALGFGTFGKIFGGLTGLFAGGGEFYTRGPQLIMVGDNPGGVERVTVEPVSGRGKTRVLNNGAIAMAGGGSVSTVPTRSSTFVTRELVSLQIDSQDVDFAIRKNGKRRNDRRQGV